MAALIEHVESVLTMCCQRGPCEDTEGWAYARSYTCWEFERRQICTRGEFGEGYRWLARWESYFNNPSSNCCACGKKQTYGPGYECGRNERTYCDELQDLGLGVCELVRLPPPRRQPAPRRPRAALAGLHQDMGARVRALEGAARVGVPRVRSQARLRVVPRGFVQPRREAADLISAAVSSRRGAGPGACEIR